MFQGSRAFGLMGACGLLLVPAPAGAFELSGGVSLGGVMAGTKPRFAVSPHAGIAWPMETGLLVAVSDVCSIMPATNGRGPGVHNQTSVAVGYASDKARFSAGPSVSFYSMLACGSTICGRVVGVSPGVHFQASMYFVGQLGLSVSAALEWMGGSSGVLPDGVAATVVAGPVVRWSTK